MSKQIRLYGVRGAVGAKNTEQDILDAVSDMCSRLFETNNIQPESIVSIQFTSTTDLTAMNPAKALRLSPYGKNLSGCALFCSAEPEIDGAPTSLIRVLVTAYMNQPPVPVYCKGAEMLRPDLLRESHDC